MQGRSSDFDDAVVNGGTVASRLDVLRDGIPIASLGAGVDGGDAGIVDGEVSVDVTANARRTMKISIADGDGSWIPRDTDDLLSVVSGNELQIWRGWQYPDGKLELLSQGIFVIDEPSVSDSTAGVSIEVSGEDRSRIVRDNAFVKTYTVPKNWDVIFAAQTIVYDRRPGTAFRGLMPGATPHTTPYLTYDEKSDPMDAVDTILSGAGLEGYFDVDGFFYIDYIPDPTMLDVSWIYTADPVAPEEINLATLQSPSTISAIKGSAHRGDIYNGVIAVGENTYGITPARAEVWDTDPHSPTYAGTEDEPGRFGRKPKFLPPNPAITLNAMALAAAQGELRRVRRLAPGYTVSVQAHPAHDGDDVVIFRRAKLGIDNRYVLQRFKVPLVAKSPSETILKRLL